MAVRSGYGDAYLWTQSFRGRCRRSSECEASLVYKVSFRIVRSVTQRNPVLKNVLCERRQLVEQG